MTMTAHNVWMSLVLVTYSSKLTTSQHQRPKVCVNFDLIIMNQNHRSKVGKKERGRFVKSTSLENPYNTKPKKRDSLSRQWTKLLTTFYQLICYIQYMIDLHSVPETHIWDYIMHTLNYRHDTCTKSKTLDNNPGWQLFIISHVTKKQKYSKSFPVHGWTDIDPRDVFLCCFIKLNRLSESKEYKIFETTVMLFLNYGTILSNILWSHWTYCQKKTSFGKEFSLLSYTYKLK